MALQPVHCVAPPVPSYSDAQAVHCTVERFNDEPVHASPSGEDTAGGAGGGRSRASASLLGAVPKTAAMQPRPPFWRTVPFSSSHCCAEPLAHADNSSLGADCRHRPPDVTVPLGWIGHAWQAGVTPHVASETGPATEPARRRDGACYRAGAQATVAAGRHALARPTNASQTGVRLVERERRGGDRTRRHLERRRRVDEKQVRWPDVIRNSGGGREPHAEAHPRHALSRQVRVAL